MLRRFQGRWSAAKTRPEEVFTPFGPATLTYVPRPAPEAALRKALTIPGMQVLVSGAPGTGKTTLVQHVLRQSGTLFIVTRCFPGTTLKQLAEDCFEQFSLLYSQKHFYKRLRRPVCLNLQWLGRSLGAHHVVWMVEDVQHLQQSDLLLLQQAVKHFADIANTFPGAQLILAYSPRVSNYLFRYDSALASRLMEVQVPQFTHDQLSNIIDKGEQLLDIVFSPEQRGNILGPYPFPARLCHQRCLTLCLQQKLHQPNKIKYLQEDRKSYQLFV